MTYSVEFKKDSSHPWRVRFTSPQGLSTILASFPTEESAQAWIAHIQTKKTIYS